MAKGSADALVCASAWRDYHASSEDLPVVCAHRLDASADTDLNHARPDLVGNVNAGLQTRRALTVEGADRGALGEAGHQGSGAHLGGATAGGQNGADADILNQGRVYLGPADDALEGTGHEVCRMCVLEATLTTLGERCPEAGGDNDLVSRSAGG